MTYVEISGAKFELVPLWWSPKTQQYVDGPIVTRPEAYIKGYLLKPVETVAPVDTRPLVGQL